MDAARVPVLLAVWERSVAQLPACRAALDAEGWTIDAAVARLEAQPPAVPRTAATGAELPGGLLSAYKRAARRDGLASAMQRSLLWATEPLPRYEAVAPWNRHRFVFGDLSERWLPASGSVGGLLRIASDMDVRPLRDEALLCHRDVTWALDHFARFSRRTGARIAVELRGRRGWVDGAGHDATLEAARAGFLEADGVSLDEMTAAAQRLDAVGAWELFDRLPSWLARGPQAAASDERMLRAARLLRDVDLVDRVADEGARLSTIDAALGPRQASDRLVVRASYRASGGATFADVVDRLLLEHRATTIGNGWREVTRAEALSTWRKSLTTEPTFGTPRLPAAEAERIVGDFVSGFAGDAFFFRNGTDSSYHPVLHSTFESGAAAVDADSVGMLFVGDED